MPSGHDGNSTASNIAPRRPAVQRVGEKAILLILINKRNEQLIDSESYCSCDAMTQRSRRVAKINEHRVLSLCFVASSTKVALTARPVRLAIGSSARRTRSRPRANDGREEHVGQQI